MSYLFPRLTRDQSDQPRSYGILRGGGKIGGRVAAVTILCATVFAGAVAVGAERPVTVVALGDSLVAGYGLAIADAFPTRLQQALADKGYAVKVVNAGVSGDTAAGGLARLDWSVADGTDAVILWSTPGSKSLYRRSGFVEPTDIFELRGGAVQPR